MDQYTRKDAERAFDRLIEAINGRVATSYNDVGAYRLDYVVEYGGFNVERIDDAKGGVSLPFGMQRHSAREFCEMVRFAIDAVNAMSANAGV